jgi:hypothetical protein
MISTGEFGRCGEDALSRVGVKRNGKATYCTAEAGVYLEDLF